MAMTRRLIRLFRGVFATLGAGRGGKRLIAGMVTGLGVKKQATGGASAKNGRGLARIIGIGSVAIMFFAVVVISYQRVGR